MACCVYDNPATMRREAWQDGRLLVWMRARCLLRKEFDGHRYPRIPFILNVGSWKTGQIVGDDTALSKRVAFDRAFSELVLTVRRAIHHLQNLHAPV